MWTKKIYKCRCGVCGREWDKESEFISGIMYQDNRVRLNCEGEFKHTVEEVREAWKKLCYG